MEGWLGRLPLVVSSLREEEEQSLHFPSLSPQIQNLKFFFLARHLEPDLNFEPLE